MIAVTQEREKIYTVELGEPELSWIKEAAKGMGIDRCSILGAAFTKGLEYYFDMLREIEHQDNNKRKPDDTERKTYDKGSCQG